MAEYGLERREKSVSVGYTAFRGVVTNTDPHDAPEGAITRAENILPFPVGAASVRDGMRRVKFLDD
jgi:hypothetical protein